MPDGGVKKDAATTYSAAKRPQKPTLRPSRRYNRFGDRISHSPFVSCWRCPGLSENPSVRIPGFYEKINLAAVFHSDPSGDASAARIYETARRHPAVPVVLYHMGFFGPHEGAIEVVKQSLDNDDADLYLGTAQADPVDVLAAVRELGSERVIFGSDATFYGATHYELYEALVDTLVKSLTPAEFANVVRQNAVRVFRLD